MPTSYKTLWQEEKRRADRLGEELERLRGVITSSRMTDFPNTPQLVDLAGVARHMRVARYTPQQWAQRQILPKPDFPELQDPVWLASSIKRFAAETGRIWYDYPPADGDLSPAA